MSGAGDVSAATATAAREHTGEGVALRLATADDVPVILQHIRGLAEYEKEPHEVEMTEETLRRDGFTEGETPLFYCLLAEADSAPAGFCLFYVAYSTWKGRYLYLEDLFVGPEYRKRGVGIKMVKAFARVGDLLQVKRLEWSALHWNEPALKFYEKIGASQMSDWVLLRLVNEGIPKLAGS
uniref:N-acetyltransferase domain-containing protein n=1 Tax=Chromera velia CCMP2878 TaxID=1169474 RepID=A0A0G4G7X5_9ALVE|mmetsp:Transcript_28104/g.55030  ORF Transcript_28104/g.55030 Transcript_28104/m.55030 type:complete len:181 (+) Transcript_28104:197-739(+)|eukprot:Cvel_20654.t1-p1 / transcript=Cvel_20654.t1 / gene=Cvel_20654 / organism=Chromera_velia_CCMP2878 / gene_product=Diamine acetyltransferase 2, putative / transcript_product=Diamine acetyltransferase 2, putative / location=Cvel_scaffold1874:11805-14230(-) / protein_length=180 / sequence_SO=supercontig / SO=protein_coding / is_pseudo=false